MSRLRSLLIAIACCLTLVVPAQASAMLDGVGPKCPALQDRLVAMSGIEQPAGENEPAITVCVGFQAIAPKGVDAPSATSVEIHGPSAHPRLAMAKRPSGIERPPRA